MPNMTPDEVQINHEIDKAVKPLREEIFRLTEQIKEVISSHNRHISNHGSRIR